MRLSSAAPMRTAKIGYAVVSGLLCALKILLMAMPAMSVSPIGFGYLMVHHKV